MANQSSEDRRWIVAAPFFSAPRPTADRWIDDFVPDAGLAFVKVGPPDPTSTNSWHSRRGRATALHGWMNYWRQARQAARLGGRAKGLVTVFPQLALVAAIQKRVGLFRQPIIAWCFNVGAPPGGPKRRLARWAFGAVDRFVVHSTREVDLVHDWFGVPKEKISFVPLQRAAIEQPEPRTEEAFVVAMGSANRDYATLVEAIAGTGIPLIIVAAKRCVEGLTLPPEVEHRTDLTHAECIALAAKARFSVVPLADVEAASGQVTIIEAMRLGRPVITTRSAGTVDYVADGKTGILVPGGDVPALREAILRLWNDGALRQAIGAAADAFAADTLSDEAAGRALARIIASVS